MDRKVKSCLQNQEGHKGNEEAMLTVSHSVRTRRDAMKLWGIRFETNKRYIFIQIVKVIVAGCCWGQRCKFARKWNKQVSKATQTGSLVAAILCLVAGSGALYQFLYETGRINHGTINGISHALFLYFFLKDPLLASGLNGPFIRQMRAVPLTKVDYKANSKLVLPGTQKILHNF